MIRNDEHFHRPLDSREEKEVRKMRTLSMKSFFHEVAHYGLQNSELFLFDGTSNFHSEDSQASLQKWVQDAGAGIASILDHTVCLSAVDNDLVSDVEDMVDYNSEGEDEPVFLKGRCVDMLWDLDAPPEWYLRDFAEFLFTFGSSEQKSAGNFGDYEQAKEFALHCSSLIIGNLQLWELQQKGTQEVEDVTGDWARAGKQRPNIELH